MAFEKAFENNYHALPQETKYRFAELEIGKAIPLLAQLHRNQLVPRTYAIRHLFQMITPEHQRYEEKEARWHEAMNSTYVNMPPKVEQIHYLITYAQSYQKIRNLTGASFNTISANRYGSPNYYPVFQEWTPEMLLTWNQIKPVLNIWNEPLVHSH